jgi:PAS domain S-box-containing protein
MNDNNDESLALLRGMAEASPLAIAVSEGADHVLRYVNPAFCRYFGRTGGELLGRPFAEACPHDDAGAARALLDRVLASGTAESVVDLSRAQAEGEASRWSYAAWPLLEHRGVAAQFTDTTGAFQEAEERRGELQRANQQLLLAALREDERSEALLRADRAKDVFLAMLAHELRNPLAAIRTGIYLLAQRAGPSETTTHETCALIERQMRHLSRLLDDLMDVSRISRGRIDLHREPVDVVQTLRYAAAASRSLLDLHRHELTLTLPAGPVWVEADPVRLEQVVTNLLQNAIKYMDPGGKVWLSVETVPGAPAPGGPSRPAAAEIRVRDQGIGIPPEALADIFDLFVQADASLDRAQGGLGIGLTLVKRLVELHGGSVSAESAGVGRGSEFRVVLPLLEPAPESPAESAKTARPPAGAPPEGTRVLVIEDNVAAATTLADVLELWGHEATIAHNGDLALAAVGLAPPDVVLLDIGLPGMDGYEVARRLRAEVGLKETLLVALTGYGQDADRRRAREAGFDHHLTKPIDLDELRRLIDAR